MTPFNKNPISLKSNNPQTPLSLCLLFLVQLQQKRPDNLSSGRQLSPVPPSLCSFSPFFRFISIHNYSKHDHCQGIRTQDGHFCITKPECSIFTSINHYRIMSPHYISIITVAKKIHQSEHCSAHTAGLLESFANRQRALFFQYKQSRKLREFLVMADGGRREKGDRINTSNMFLLLGKAKQKTFD